MRLGKNKLINKTKFGLKELGFRNISHLGTVAEGLYIKKIDKDLFLTLGMTISKYYNSMFTASYYLSKSTTWGCVWGDIPKKSYERVGYFLTTDERKYLLLEEFQGVNIRDAWWAANEENGINNFLKTIEITEERFLSQKQLYADIENSEEVAELHELSKKVIEEIKEQKLFKPQYNFLSSDKSSEIPREWFEIAEIVLEKNHSILNNNTVKRLAMDAWRQIQVSK